MQMELYLEIIVLLRSDKLELKFAFPRGHVVYATL